MSTIIHESSAPDSSDDDHSGDEGQQALSLSGPSRVPSAAVAAAAAASANGTATVPVRRSTPNAAPGPLQGLYGKPSPQQQPQPQRTPARPGGPPRQNTGSAMNPPTMQSARPATAAAPNRQSGGPGPKQQPPSNPTNPHASPPPLTYTPTRDRDDSAPASATPPNGLAEADDLDPLALKAALDKVTAEFRMYKRTTQEELETAKRSRVSLQNQLNEAQSALAESTRANTESASRITELQAQLLKSRAAAESELNFFNLEVEKEIARSKQDKEKVRLQATLASYEEAHKKNKTIINTLNGEIVKLKTAYKNLVASSTAAAATAPAANNGVHHTEGANALPAPSTSSNGLNSTVPPAISPSPLAVPADSNGNGMLSPSKSPQTEEQIHAKAEIARLNKLHAAEQAALAAEAELHRHGSSSAHLLTTVPELQERVVQLETAASERNAAHVAALEAQLADFKASAAKSLEDATLSSAQRGTALQEARDELAAATTKLSQVESQSAEEIASAKSQIAGLRTQLAAAQTQLASTQKELDDSQAQTAAATASAASAAQSADKKIQSLQSEKQSEMSTASAAHESALQKRFAQIATLQKEVEALKIEAGLEATKVEAERTKLNARVRELTADLSKAHTTMAARENDFTAARKTHATQVETLNSRIAELEQQLADSESKRSQESEEAAAQSAMLKAEIAALEQTLEQLKADSAARLSDRDSTIASLRAELAALHSSHAEYVETTNNAKAALEAIVASTRSLLGTSQERLKEKTSEYVSLSARSSATIEQQKATIEDLSNQVADLSARLAQKQSALSAYHEQIDFNVRRREEAAKATPVKKAGLFDSLARKLHLDGSGKNGEAEVVDMFSSIDPAAGGAGAAGGVGATPGMPLDKDQQNELAEEVAVSLTRRLQQSENEKLELEKQLALIRRQMAASRPTPGAPGSGPSTRGGAGGPVRGGGQAGPPRGGAQAGGPPRGGAQAGAQQQQQAPRGPPTPQQPPRQ